MGKHDSGLQVCPSIAATTASLKTGVGGGDGHSAWGQNQRLKIK